MFFQYLSSVVQYNVVWYRTQNSPLMAYKVWVWNSRIYHSNVTLCLDVVHVSKGLKCVDISAWVKELLIICTLEIIFKFHTCGPTLLFTGAVCGKFKNESHKWLDHFIDRLDISLNRYCLEFRALFGWS